MDRCALCGKFRDPVPGVKLGASAYPMMISQVLDETPKTQTAIKQAVFEKYGKKMDRKAVSRNLTLLEELEYNIQKIAAQKEKNYGIIIHTNNYRSYHYRNYHCKRTHCTTG